MLPEQPDRLGASGTLSPSPAEEAPEGKSVLDLELGLVVRQAVERLQNHDLEHHHRIVRRPATLRAIGALLRLAERLAENLPRHHRIQLLQRIVGLAQPQLEHVLFNPVHILRP